ncbi:MAG: hypothetical protein DRJ09_10975 [Bacteroidetes bacterium]|nr:MAG: hypothetical protein DRJ09_10975 [Bacteroidota bacterium]
MFKANNKTLTPIIILKARLLGVLILTNRTGINTMTATHNAIFIVFITIMIIFSQIYTFYNVFQLLFNVYR